MFQPGDLVIISDDCDLEYFGGKTAIIVRNVGQDATDHSHGFYYELHFADGTSHIFTHRELALLSRAERKKNENR
jgi:hypothetical protein